jgi:hypothetical protein
MLRKAVSASAARIGRDDARRHHVSRYVVDPSTAIRAAGAHSIRRRQHRVLVPTLTFANEPIYSPGDEPDSRRNRPALRGILHAVSSRVLAARSSAWWRATAMQSPARRPFGSSARSRVFSQGAWPNSILGTGGWRELRAGIHHAAALAYARRHDILHFVNGRLQGRLHHTLLRRCRRAASTQPPRSRRRRGAT